MDISNLKQTENNMTIPEFIPWPKIPRLNRECVITEKLDGTNASILITSDGQVVAGSRTRWITPQNDNYGFAAWVEQNKAALLELGEGHHFGEWWGAGIQRHYNLTSKRFSLFNTYRWNELNPPPACCSIVPVLYKGIFHSDRVTVCLERLRIHGSMAAPFFMQPEGIVVYHTAAKQCFKVTLEKDNEPKGA